MLVWADTARRLDPRLKLAMALIVGPGIWLWPSWSVLCCLVFFSILAHLLSLAQPLGRKTVISLFLFVLFWLCIKLVLDVVSGVPLGHVFIGVGLLGLRLTALLLLGLSLALSSSARALAMAVAWGVRPLVGAERAWRLALSLALMIHFFPMCLSTMNQVRETVTRRWPHCRFYQRAILIPQVVLRHLGQKTWTQTLAIAGRGLDCPQAWEPVFKWDSTDSICCLAFCPILVLFFLA